MNTTQSIQRSTLASTLAWVFALAVVFSMRAHAAAGNRAEALRAYEQCRQLLAEELGVAPSAETQAVHLMVLQAR